ncbi:hypothetical protein ACFE04_013338 [Oxalis oulophora]
MVWWWQLLGCGGAGEGCGDEGSVGSCVRPWWFVGVLKRSAYENLEFCNTFHSEEAGWRNCFTCDKRLHCGCIVSKHLFEHRDLGGVVCASCPRDPQNYNHDADHVQDAINQVSDDSSGEYFSPSESDSETTAETRNTKRKGRRPTRNTKRKGRRPTRNTKRKGRRPVGGQGESVLLSRYDPKITKQQLEKMRQDLGCDVVPLFEKVLSASDVGKIGRIVLPRACAEAYLPPIDEPDGIPLLIQDVQGNDYNFRLRFWPNNRTRMYVVEGAMHFVQALQLEAGDTIIFSRTDPGRKLLLGIRRASKSKGKQHAQTSTSSTGARAVETSSSSHSDVPNIGSKRKRLQMNRAEALELRSTWEEPPRLLCASPNFVPNVVTLGQDYDILEYDEPPIFGKQTKFITLSSGVREQWAQCDDCSKWRKLPFDVLLPAKWTCSENTWDASRTKKSVQRSCILFLEQAKDVGASKRLVEFGLSTSLVIKGDNLGALANNTEIRRSWLDWEVDHVDQGDQQA